MNFTTNADRPHNIDTNTPPVEALANGSVNLRARYMLAGRLYPFKLEGEDFYALTQDHETVDIYAAI